VLQPRRTGAEDIVSTIEQLGLLGRDLARTDSQYLRQVAFLFLDEPFANP
jgi:hypothetical protein